MSARAERASVAVKDTVNVTPGDRSFGDFYVGNFDPKAYEVLYGGVPMPEIPLTGEWLNQIDSEDIPVAEHELGHAFVAFSMGIGLRFATVIPDHSAGYRGLTVLEHAVDPHDLQIVSAAGSHKSPHGNSGDRMIHNALGGRSFEASLAHARNIIGSLTDEEWKIMVQIFAYKRTIYETDIPQMLRRARFELGRGVTPDETLFEERIRTIRGDIDAAKVVGIIRDEVIEELQPDGTVKRYHKVNGVVDESSIEIFCATCGMKEGHMRDCTKNPR